MTDRVVAIWNSFSRRKVGDASLLEEFPDDIVEQGVCGPYAKLTPDGHALTSVSAVLQDGEGRRRGLLCLNFDRAPFDGAIDMLTRFAAPCAPRPPALFNREWREQISLVVDETCRARHLRRDRLTRADRLFLVKVLRERGLFATRQAASHAGLALGVSRATVYALLKEAVG